MYEKLYEDNRRLLRYVARRYWAACRRDRAVSVEDLEQAGFFGLIRAEETFDPAVGYTWTTWAIWAIIREIYKTLGYRDGKATRAYTGALSLDAPVSEEDPEGLTYLDTLADPDLAEIDEDVILSDLQRCVREAVADLKDERQRAAIQACDLDGLTLNTEAAILGISPQRVSQIIRDGHRKLKRDRRLANLYDLEQRTPYHHHRGVQSFFRTQTSDTEAAAIWRLEHEQQKGSRPHDTVYHSRTGKPQRDRDRDPRPKQYHSGPTAGPAESVTDQGIKKTTAEERRRVAAAEGPERDPEH